ncbi:calcium/sodium antiporter [Actinobacillus delphinicola]|uniref:calcium/sodium antiporter n=1 Tax=Actinobacillus delphinicola TaxID=51161 RepID=UPI0024429A0F|nr:calcium/sodium antiporter [Actinobacillus delphinicola]MDG6896792.1 calcium/sodium antiporter [Actinobacillus delphinicola]
MLLPYIALIAGLVILVGSADYFVKGASSIAKTMGMSPLLIGILIIGFGTSAPEMIVSAISSLNGSPTVALGNAYGSIITNIGLILGITALIKPIAVTSTVIKKELPILFVATLISAWMIADNYLSRDNAWILLLLFGLYILWSIWNANRQQEDPLSTSFTENLDNQPDMSLNRAIVYMLGGLIALMASSEALVWGAVKIAEYFGVSDLVIGLTIVAVGTSLPELATSIIAARRGETDLAMGNLIGSNMFNILAVVGISGVILPAHLNPEVFERDMMVIITFTLSLFILGYDGKTKPGRISRVDGTLLLIGYIAYSYVLLRKFL